MATLFHVSLQSTESELINWIQERMAKNELSPSLVFRDAMTKLKQDFDIKNNANPKILQDTINTQKQTIHNLQDFVEKQGLNNAWFEYWANLPKLEEKPKEVIEDVPI